MSLLSRLSWGTAARAALVGDVELAVFRTFDGMLHAVGNQDPFSGAFVLSRGIVGTRGDEPTATPSRSR